MSEARDAEPFEEARALRQAAWGLMREDIDHLRTSLAARPVGQRIKDKATDSLVDAAGMARDVAAENKAVVAGTLAALAAWALRGPIVSGIAAAVQRFKHLK